MNNMWIQKWNKKHLPHTLILQWTAMFRVRILRKKIKMIDCKVIFCWIIKARSLIKPIIKVHKVFIKSLLVATLIQITSEFNKILIMSHLKKTKLIQKKKIQKKILCQIQFSKYIKISNKQRKLVENRLNLKIKLSQ